MRDDRLLRLIGMLNTFESGHAASANYLATVHECTRRTIFRDIADLRKLGFDVRYCRQLGGYQMAGRHTLRVSKLSADEAIAVIVAVATSPLSALPFFRRSLDQAAAMLLSQLDEGVRNEANRLIRSIVWKTSTPPRLSLSDELAHHVFTALARRECIRVAYRLPDVEEGICTKLSLYLIELSEQDWTLVGRSTHHRRVVRVPAASITRGELTGETFEVPAAYAQSGATGSGNGPHFLNFSVLSSQPPQNTP